MAAAKHLSKGRVQKSKNITGNARWYEK